MKQCKSPNNWWFFCKAQGKTGYVSSFQSAGSTISSLYPSQFWVGYMASHDKKPKLGATSDLWEMGSSQKLGHLKSIEIFLREWPVPPGFIYFFFKLRGNQCTPEFSAGSQIDDKPWGDSICIATPRPKTSTAASARRPVVIKWHYRKWRPERMPIVNAIFKWKLPEN